MRDVTKCPKCGSARIACAADEAPPWATHWTKCFACGKRWNLGGPPRKIQEETEDHADRKSAEHDPRPKRSGEDLVRLVMQVAREHQATQKKETTMARCTKGSCPDEAADDSVRCPKHRDMQRASNEHYQGRAGSAAGKPKRKYTRRLPLGGTRSTAVATIEPKVVSATPVRRADLNGNVLTVLDVLLQKMASDTAAVERTKELLERHG